MAHRHRRHRVCRARHRLKLIHNFRVLLRKVPAPRRKNASQTGQTDRTAGADGRHSNANGENNALSKRATMIMGIPSGAYL
eukprot:2158505-Pleurochrysis_carterae.AAC.2